MMPENVCFWKVKELQTFTGDYGNLTLYVSTVSRYVSSNCGNSRLKWESKLGNGSHSGRPATAVNVDKAKQSDVLITSNTRKYSNEL